MSKKKQQLLALIALATNFIPVTTLGISKKVTVVDRTLYRCSADDTKYLLTLNNGCNTLEESNDGKFRGRDIPLLKYKKPPGFAKLGGGKNDNNAPIGLLAPGAGKDFKVLAELDIPACNYGNTKPSFRKLKDSKGQAFWVRDDSAICTHHGLGYFHIRLGADQPIFTGKTIIQGHEGDVYRVTAHRDYLTNPNKSFRTEIILPNGKIGVLHHQNRDDQAKHAYVMDAQEKVYNRPWWYKGRKVIGKLACGDWISYLDSKVTKDGKHSLRVTVQDGPNKELTGWLGFRG
ncbi:MAG: hypothetical protein RLZ12_112 [Bacillota bacterium]|jgi:hypothetical protein